MSEYSFYDSAREEKKETLASFTSKTFMWMFIGLLASFAAALVVLYFPAVFNLLYGNPYGIWGIVIIELVLVAVLSLSVHKVKPSTATVLFFLYSLVNGLMLSSIFLVYEITTIAYAFLGSAGIFGIMALYGYFTKKDLTRIGRILMLGLIGCVIYSVIGLIFGMSTTGLIYSLIVIAVFMGITAFDVQKIKHYYYAFDGNEDMLHKCAIICALQLYLDFINIFLRLLSIMGRSNRRR